MRAVIREYAGTGARELFEFMEHHRTEIEQEIRTVHGLISYTLARNGDGGFSVTVCEDQAGIDESIQKSKEWVATHAPHIAASHPHVVNARVVVHQH
jgi:hypothetical protein